MLIPEGTIGNYLVLALCEVIITEGFDIGQQPQVYSPWCCCCIFQSFVSVRTRCVRLRMIDRTHRLESPSLIDTRLLLLALNRHSVPLLPSLNQGKIFHNSTWMFTPVTYTHAPNKTPTHTHAHTQQNNHPHTHTH